MSAPPKPSDPFVLKTLGYLASGFSVLALGVAAWPGAAEFGLEGWLIAGMAGSILGMCLRWLSYYREKKADPAAPIPQSDPPAAQTPQAAAPPP